MANQFALGLVLPLGRDSHGTGSDGFFFDIQIIGQLQHIADGVIHAVFHVGNVIAIFAGGGDHCEAIRLGVDFAATRHGNAVAGGIDGGVVATGQRQCASDQQGRSGYNFHDISLYCRAGGKALFC